MSGPSVFHNAGQTESASGDIGNTTHVFLALCVLMCVAFFIWAAVSKLDIVSMTTGEVIPYSQVKSIQHLEGGIVLEIAVREGDRVKKDQPLITLESTASGADVGELRVRLNALRMSILRLEAEAAGSDKPVFPEDLTKEHPQLVSQALEQFKKRKRQRDSDIVLRTEAAIQREQDIREISARIKNQRDSLKLLNEQIAISEDLLKDDLTNRYNHLNLLRDASRLQGKIEEDKAALERAKSALNEAQATLENIRSNHAVETGKELEEARLNYNELTQRFQKFEDSLSRTVLRSPVNGVVKTLYVTTIGGVLKPGSTVIDIVPAGDRLIIEAKLPTQDIGYVRRGQTAQVKLASADALRFGNLPGTVVNVSPDTLVTKEGVPFYKVRIETASDHFQRGDLRYQLFPGMQVMTNIQTGQRTVLEYLLDPFLRSFDEAMLER
ncbi:MAG: HlyD family type I secretion periplasmic adaptor subunit [Rhodospirillales bacterium]